jgi:hypothetical protein
LGEPVTTFPRNRMALRIMRTHITMTLVKVRNLFPGIVELNNYASNS